MTTPVRDAMTCRCGLTTKLRLAGWIDETWPTLGGGTVHITLCPECRRLVTAYEGGERCDGRCGGHNTAALAWRGQCLTCQDDYDETTFAESPADANPDQFAWSCWERGCVEAWATTHPGHEVRICRGGDA